MEERSQYVTTYLESRESSPTQDELTTISNYILWGVDSSTGLNGHQSRLYDLKSKASAWDGQNADSLDAMAEAPEFCEASLHPLGSVALPKNPRRKFDREKEITNAGGLTPDLKELWRHIDELDWQIEQYELMHGRRSCPIRQELINQLAQYGTNIKQLNESVVHWNQRKYLKKKHELVELREQQYTLKDSYAPAINYTKQINIMHDNEFIDWGGAVQVKPLGLKQGQAAQFIFKNFRSFCPDQLDEEQLKTISKRYWDSQTANGATFVDFCNVYHVQRFIENKVELKNASSLTNNIESNIEALIDTFDYYVEEAKLDEKSIDILTMKMYHIHNKEIARVINEKYNHTYNENYISTIYCQQILAKIAETAQRHRQLIENIFYPENWKTCTLCGATLLRDDTNFTRRARSKDGFNTRCKQCEKQARLDIKEAHFHAK